MLFHLCERVLPPQVSELEVLLAALHAYDRRGGGVETQNKGDKQGLGLSHRNKHSFAAQEMLVLLGQLAHNVLIWTRNDLARIEPRLEKYGIQCTQRDALQIDGRILLDQAGEIQHIILNDRHPLAAIFQTAFLNEM
jgi:hypothetical protein